MYFEIRKSENMSIICLVYFSGFEVNFSSLVSPVTVVNSLSISEPNVPWLETNA